MIKLYGLAKLLPLLLAMAILGLSGPVMAAGGPQLGKPAMGPGLDKSGDAVLAKMIAEIAPQFVRHEFRAGDAAMGYSLFTPEKKPGEKYPLVLFIADASTPGADVERPLKQGYGALVWATKNSQADHPCYVLVPQFSGVAVNDLYEHTSEVETVLAMLAEVIKNNDVDPDRVYITGQSMGGMIAMYYNIAHPGIFAASLFVDCHWDHSKMDSLVEHPFIFIYAGHKGKGYLAEQAIEAAARKMDVGYTWAEWSARLPQAKQDELCATMLAKGKPVNLIGFEDGTVLPESGKGSEHMYSFDHAYQLKPARDWLFGHSLQKTAKK